MNFSTSLTKKNGFSYYNYKGTIDYPDTPWKSDFSQKTKVDRFSSNVTMDYKINDKSTIGFVYSNSFTDNNETTNGKSKIFDGNGSYLDLNGFNNNLKNNHTVNAHYIQKLDTLGRKISFDIDYFKYQDKGNDRFSSERFITSLSKFTADNNSARNIKNYSIKTDITHPTKWVNFSYGAKITQTKTNSEVSFYNHSSGTPIFDPTRSNEFEYTENIQAVYSGFSKKINDKLHAKIGLRLEHTNTKGYSKTNVQTDKNEYTKLFPTLYLGYTANKNNIINFNYNRRIERPSFYNLNPFRMYTNANSYAEGNPFLKPVINDNIELTHIYKGKLISKAYAYYIYGGSSQIINLDEDTKTQIMTRENFYNGSVYGLTETYLYNPTKWWKTTSMFTTYKMNGYFTKQVMDAELITNWIFQVYNKNSFFLNTNKTIQAEVTCLYTSRQKQLFVDIEPLFMANFGLNFSLLDKKLHCTVAVNDIFRKTAPTIYMKSNGIKQSHYNYNDNQDFKISLSYNFGNSKIRTKKRTSGNNEEQNRAN